MATLSINPTYPIPGIETTITLSPSNSGTNYYKVWATVAPTGSSIDNKIKSTLDPRNRIEVYSDSGGADFPFKYNFDKGGKYTFKVQEYIKGSGYGGAFQGDPAGSDSEVKNGAESTVYVYVGQRLTQKIGPPEHRATLVVWVWNRHIQATYKHIHGEDTPAIIASQLTDRVKSAIESEGVKSALLGIVDMTAEDAMGFNGIKEMVFDYFTNWNLHVSNSTFHDDADNINKLDPSLERAYLSNTIKDFVNSAISRQRLHFSNDNSLDTSATPPIGPGYGLYHTNSDKPNITLYTSVSSQDEAVGALVDLWRCYENHRTASGVHVNDDTVRNLEPLKPIMLIHKAYLDVIADDNPTPPLAQSTAAQLLISSLGFKE